jgi:hypothetical protein
MKKNKILSNIIGGIFGGFFFLGGQNQMDCYRNPADYIPNAHYYASIKQNNSGWLNSANAYPALAFVPQIIRRDDNADQDNAAYKPYSPEGLNMLPSEKHWSLPLGVILISTGLVLVVAGMNRPKN